MNYYINKEVAYSFEESIEKITASLKGQGFGIVTEMNVSATLKEKIDVDFRPYKILGACNPKLAHKALQMEDKIGTLLPCNVIVQENEQGKVEVAIIDPVAMFNVIDHPEMKKVAADVREMMGNALEKI